MTYAASPNDPYRAQGPAAAFGPIPSGIRHGYLGLAITTGVMFVLTVGGFTAMFATADHHQQQPNEGFIAVAIGSYFLLILSLFVQLVLGVVWIHRAWSWLPFDQRYTRGWRSWISPSQASLFLLIPYFHYYWMFVVNQGLCEALDRLRVMYPTREPAPKNLAVTACILQLLFWPLAPVFWLMFMSRIETMTKEMAMTAQTRRANAF